MPSSPQARILAIEDNTDTQVLLRYLLRSRYDIEIVPHVDDALDAAASNEYDLFLLDINLGEERTGIDLLHELRKLERYRDTPAVALTAYAMPGDKERLEQAGFTGYLSKPFTRKELHGVIEEMLNRERSTGE